MNIYEILVGLGILCAFWNIAVTLMIYGALERRGITVSFILLRLMAPVYAFRYKEITKSETGQVGGLFFHWLISINLALVLVVVGLIGLA